MANRVLILFAHPALQKSRVNRRLIAAVRNMENVTINDLYEEYPDFFVDIKREQELLLSHDIIIFQHPLYWYSCPALLKEWQDLVLQYGFAYGAQWTKLNVKWVLTAITAGGPLSAYQRDSCYGRSNKPFGFAEWFICRPLSSAEHWQLRARLSLLGSRHFIGTRSKVCEMDDSTSATSPRLAI